MMSSHRAEHETDTNSLGAEPGFGAAGFDFTAFVGQTALATDSVVDHNTPAPAAANGTLTSPSNSPKLKQKRRACAFPGCTNTVKAQNHCQKHGAIIKRCKAPDCKNQAQGGYQGYCKRHWRECFAPEQVRKNAAKKSKEEEEEEEQTRLISVGPSVFDHILPASFSWKGDGINRKKSTKKDPNLVGFTGEVGAGNIEFIPILQHFVDNNSLEPGWHRLNERLARGMHPPKSFSVQLEPWENQLILMEMALIAGTDTKHLTEQDTTKIIAHAWGREKGFLKLLLSKHCSRKGDVNRKKRKDAGSVRSVKKQKPSLMVQESVMHQQAASLQESSEATGTFEMPVAI